MSAVLACDLGGTSVRAALVDLRGAVLAERAVAAPRPTEGAGRSEIDATSWWDAFVEASGRLADAAPGAFAAVEGIAICGVTRTQVLLDGDGALLGPAMTWNDTRAGEAAARLRGRLGDHPEAERVNAFHPLARLAWLGEAEPAVAASLACVLEPKDYLNHRLTGLRASDPISTARLLAAAEPAPGGSALARAGFADAILPAMCEPQAVVGPVRAGLPAPLDRLAGIPVFCCANDTWTAVLGLGALRSGHAYNISGTTEVLGLVGAHPASAEGLLTVDWRGLWQLGGPSQNGADTVAWLLDLVGGGRQDVAASVDALLAGERRPRPVLFLPYLQGERVPYWDPDLRGAFLGLDRRHGPTDLAYAVLEGVAFLNRVVLERAEAALGEPAREIRFGGGAAANPVWAQVKADVLGRPIVVGAGREPGILGAAIVAWTGLGRHTSLAEAQERLVAVDRRFEPDARRRAGYDALYGLYRRAETALAPLSGALAGFDGGLAGRSLDVP